MNNVFYYLAAEGESLPMEGGNSILLPKTYDIVWSLIPFLIILIVFAMFVIPMFQELFQEREDRSEGGIKRAEAQQAEAKADVEKCTAQLGDARAEADEMSKQARERCKQSEAQAKQPEAYRAQVGSELRSDTGQNSINLAEKLLGGELSESTKQSATIDNFLSELDSVASAGK